MKVENPRTHKLGANRKETACRPRKHHANFSHSRDIREDRRSRQEKLGRGLRTVVSVQPPGKEHLLLPRFATGTKHPTTVKLKHDSASKVAIAGTFNGWHSESIPLHLVEADQWVVELYLDPGVYEYRFIIDGQWADDPRAKQRVSNGFGGENCLLCVP